MTPEDDPRYKVVNAEIQNLLRDIGRTLKGAMPEGWGFTLLIYDYVHPDGSTGALFYMSSALREDMVKTMREFLRKQGENE